MLACEIADWLLQNGAWGGSVVTITANMAFVPASVSNLASTTRTPGAQKIIANGTLSFQGLQTVPTTQTALVFGSVAAQQGYCWLHNADDVNYIQVGLVVSGTFYPFLQLYPGDMQIVRLIPGVTYYGLANVADVDLEAYAVQN